MKNPKQERRQFSRIGFEANVIIAQQQHEYPAKLVDISLNGVLVATPPRYQVRTDMPCTLSINLANDVVITMQVTLVHSSTTLLGFHCTSIDMDSIAHLRRLIEINLDDPNASERVLGELLKRNQS